MLDWKQCDAVEQTVGMVGGAWLFKGTRVPVKALFENLVDRRDAGGFSGMVSRLSPVSRRSAVLAFA